VPQSSVVRVPLDVYNTPLGLATKIVERLRPSLPRMLSIWEPCVGSGTFLQALGKGYRTHATDIRPDAPGLGLAKTSEVLDLASAPELPRAAWILGNLPYNLADRILPRLLPQADVTALLFRINYLGGQERQRFWKANPVQHLLVTSERPSFVSVCSRCAATVEPGPTECPCGGRYKKQTDSTEYATFIWTRNRKPLPGFLPVEHL
jgi:hypothetical protein